MRNEEIKLIKVNFVHCLQVYKGEKEHIKKYLKPWYRLKPSGNAMNHDDGTQTGELTEGGGDCLSLRGRLS